MKTNKYFLTLYRFIPFFAFLCFWEIAATTVERGVFFFGSPTTVGRYIILKTLDGSLLSDMGVTLGETILGFMIGNIIGTTLGLFFWYFPRISVISKPYILALGSIPIFAVSPIIIIWFGIGIISKILLAAISTIVIAVVQAYEGAAHTDKKLIEQFLAMGATKFQTFRIVVIPSTIAWLFAGYKINVGFALLGAFIGEFISSEKGLGHTIILAMGLFNIPLVLTGVFGIIVLSLLLTGLVGYAQRILIPWVRL